MTERKSNYAMMAEAAQELFTQYDITEPITRLGFESDNEYLYIPFFGDRYTINRKTGEVCSPPEVLSAHTERHGRSATFNAAMSIYDVICYSKPGAVLTGQWRMLQGLSPHSNFRSAGGAGDFGKQAKHFSEHFDECLSRCEARGRRIDGKADAEFEFDAFPFLPLLLRFWSADEEFPAKIDLLFDAGALDFIRFETAWYVGGYLMDLITGA